MSALRIGSPYYIQYQLSFLFPNIVSNTVFDQSRVVSIVFEIVEDKMTTTRTGNDGVRVEIPAGATSRMGNDGRVVAIPAGATSRMGNDGRVVAIPAGATSQMNLDGRIVVKR